MKKAIDKTKGKTIRNRTKTSYQYLIKVLRQFLPKG
jgi:hypothetical protein